MITRVVLIDDQVMVRSGIRYLISEHRGLLVVAEGTWAEGEALAADYRPHVIVLAPRGGQTTPEALRAIRDASPGSGILLLASGATRLARLNPFECGIKAIVAPEEPPDVLVQAIERAHRGESRTAPRPASSRGGPAPERAIDSDRELARIALLTRRELEIVALVGEGLRNRPIAQRLSISEATVRNHLTSVLDKLNLVDRFDLAVYAFRHGLARVR